MLWIVFSLFCIKYIRVGFEGNINALKKGFTPAMECTNGDKYQVNKIVFTSPKAMDINYRYPQEFLEKKKPSARQKRFFHYKLIPEHM